MFYGVSIKDTYRLIEDYPEYLDDIVDYFVKQKKVGNIGDEVSLANAVRVAHHGDKTDFPRWVRTKQREIWKITTTEEEKEEQALESWKNLSNKGTVGANKRK